MESDAGSDDVTVALAEYGALAVDFGSAPRTSVRSSGPPMIVVALWS